MFNDLLMIFEFFYGWSWNTVDVLRPQIREALDLSLTQAGSMYTAQSLGALIGATVAIEAVPRVLGSGRLGSCACWDLAPGRVCGCQYMAWCGHAPGRV